MQLGNSVYTWWYWGIGGLGGWSLFLLLAIAAMAYVFFDSANRGIRAPGWRLGTLLPLILFAPTVLFRFSNPVVQPINAMASEWFLVMGVLGAIIAIAAAVGYAVSYWGVTQPTAVSLPGPTPIPSPAPPPPRSADKTPPSKPQRDSAGAWLVDGANNRQYILYRGDTKLGRQADNDVVFSDLTVSREQALIRAEGNTFTLYDRGSSAGTFVNGQRVRSPALLYHGDAIEMGEVKLTFVTSQR